jgi:hypothetical protein
MAILNFVDEMVDNLTNKKKGEGKEKKKKGDVLTCLYDVPFVNIAYKKGKINS